MSLTLVHLLSRRNIFLDKRSRIRSHCVHFCIILDISGAPTKQIWAMIQRRYACISVEMVHIAGFFAASSAENKIKLKLLFLK